MSSNRSSQQNSIIRALKLLEILKSGTDSKHKLTQEQLLSLMKKMDGSCTLKTMRTDLRNLMNAINPILDDTRAEYKDHHEDYLDSYKYTLQYLLALVIQYHGLIYQKLKLNLRLKIQPYKLPRSHFNNSLLNSLLQARSTSHTISI